MKNTTRKIVDGAKVVGMSALLALGAKDAVADGKNNVDNILTKQAEQKQTLKQTYLDKEKLKFELNSNKEFLTFEKAGLKISDLRKQAVFLDSPEKVHQFILNLLEKDISPKDIEKLIPTVRITPAPVPLAGVVPVGHEKDSINFEGINLPEKVTLENFKEVSEKIIIPRNSDPKYVERWNNFVKKYIDTNPELAQKVVDSINMYLSKVKEGNNQHFKGEGLNPYLLERGFTRIAFIQQILDSDPRLETTFGKEFLADVYMILVALGEDVDNAQRLELEGGESYIIIPLELENLVALYDIGIDINDEKLVAYKEKYENFIGEIENRTKKRFAKAKKPRTQKRIKRAFLRNMKTFNGLSNESKIQALDLYTNRIQEKLIGKDAEAKLAVMLISFQSSLDNYKNYLAGGELDTKMLLNLQGEAKMINDRYPGTFTAEQMEIFKQVEGFVGIELDKENEKLSQKSEQLSQEIKEKKEFIKKLKLLVSL